MDTKVWIYVVLLMVGVHGQSKQTQSVDTSAPRPKQTQQEIREEANGFIMGCAKEYHVSRNQLKLLGNPVKLTVMKASNNIKCFAKCVIYDSGFYTKNDFDIERVVYVTVSQGKLEKNIRAMAARCRVLLEGIEDCHHFWEVYRCFHGSV